MDVGELHDHLQRASQGTDARSQLLEINSLCCFGKMAGLPRKTALVSRQGSPSPSGSTRPSSRPRSDRKTAGPSGGRRTSRPRCKLTSPDCGSPRSPTATWKKTPVFPRRHGIGALLALPRPRSLPAVGADTRPTIHLAQLRVIPNQLQAFTRKTHPDQVVPIFFHGRSRKSDGIRVTRRGFGRHKT